MEFWKSKIDDSDIRGKMSSHDDDDDDILKHVQNLDIGDNFMDDEDLEDSYESEENGNPRENRREKDINGDYPDDLSDISDIFESDNHLLKMDIGQGLSNGAVKDREAQMLSLDEVTYSRDLKWINTPEDDRPKPRVSRTNNRFLKQVQGITSSNQSELGDLDRHYKNLDQKKKEYEFSGPPGSRDRRRGRTTGGLMESQFIPPPEPATELAARGPGKLVVFDDDPKPSQRRKRPPRTRPPREARGERDFREPRERGETGRLRVDLRESRDRGNRQSGENGDTQSRQSNQRGNGNLSQSQSPRSQTQGQNSRGPYQAGTSQMRSDRERHEQVTIQTRNKPFISPTTTNQTNPIRSVPLAQSSQRQQQITETLIETQTNAIKLRANAPAWKPSFAT